MGIALVDWGQSIGKDKKFSNLSQMQFIRLI